MSASPHGSQATSPRRDVVVPGLLLIVAALAIVCVWQRAEYRRLITALDRPDGTGLPILHKAKAQSFIVAPHPTPAPRRGANPDEDGAAFSAAGIPFEFKPRPANLSPVARLLNNPEFFQALQLHRQATLDTRFAPLFRQLSLNAEELTAFKRLLTEKENAALDVIAISESQAEGPLPDPLLGASVNAARARADTAIRNALGADRYAVYAEYEKTLPQRTVVAQLEQRLSYSPTPLTSSQSESLVKILSVHAPAPATASAETAPTSAMVVTTGALAGTGVELHTPPAIVTNDAVAEALPVLAPSQVAALREIQAEQQATSQAYQILRATLPAHKKFDAIALEMLLQ